MNNISFGQYYPKDSIIHKLDPRIKLVLVTLYIVLVFISNSFYCYAVIATFLLGIIFLSKIPIFNVLKTVKVIAFILLFTAILNVFFYREGETLIDLKIVRITVEGIINASFMALRLILLVIGTSMLSLTTTPMQLTDGIEALLRPLKVVRFPVHDLAIIMSIALRFIPILAEETDKIMKAQKARGASFDQGGLIKRAKSLLPILIPLFVSAFRRAEELAYALDARCYNATPNRTKMKKLTVQFKDFVALVILSIILTYAFLLKYNVLPTFF